MRTKVAVSSVIDGGRKLVEVEVYQRSLNPLWFSRFLPHDWAIFLSFQKLINYTQMIIGWSLKCLWFFFKFFIKSMDHHFALIPYPKTLHHPRMYLNKGPFGGIVNKKSSQNYKLDLKLKFYQTDIWMVLYKPYVFVVNSKFNMTTITGYSLTQN